MKSPVARPVAAALAAALALALLAPIAPRPAPGPVKVLASVTTKDVDGSQDFALPSDTTHIAIHWPGKPQASVTAAFSTDGVAFSEPAKVEIDEVGASRGDGQTYGSLMSADGMRVVRISADRPLSAVSVLALNAGGPDPPPLGLGAQAAGATNVPAVIPRSAWGADESLRFDAAGDELWPREYFPLQKLVVHHTAGRNADPDPAATVRAIYYYHAITQGWGDIGYQYLIDEAGRVYEGRYSRDYWNGATPTADNGTGLVVAGGHALYYNAGTMGIALLGTFDAQPPTPAAQASLARMLAWAAATHGIDPNGSGLYTNPLTGLTRVTPNIGGHRDYNATGCPGGVLYSLLPAIRSQVAARMNTWPGVTYNPRRTLTFAAGTYVGRAFSAAGAITASKSYTLPRASAAPTSQLSTVPGQGGSWFFVTAGVWAGYWLQASSALAVSGAPPSPVVTAFDPARPLFIGAGTYVGRRFDTYGTITSSKSYRLPGGSMTWTTQRGTIPRQSGNWYYVTGGVWEGYWIPESPGTTLGNPPPPAPPPIASYDPPRTLWFATGTYVGRRFSPYGVLAGSKSFTLTKGSSALTSEKSTILKQSGNWYHVTVGVWAGYWMLESTGITLGPP